MTPCSPRSRLAWRVLFCGAVAATASLDRGCARRRYVRQVGTKKRPFRSNKETDRACRSGRHGFEFDGFEFDGLGFGLPWCCARDHGVDVDDELAGAGDEGGLVRFDVGDEPPVEGAKLRVP